MIFGIIVGGIMKKILLMTLIFLASYFLPDKFTLTMIWITLSLIYIDK